MNNPGLAEMTVDDPVVGGNRIHRESVTPLGDHWPPVAGLARSSSLARRGVPVQCFPTEDDVPIPPLVVAIGELSSDMAAPRLFPLQSSLDHKPGDAKHVLQLPTAWLREL